MRLTKACLETQGDKSAFGKRLPEMQGGLGFFVFFVVFFFNYKHDFLILN